MAYYDKDVEKLLGEGLTYALIGEKLGITEKQVNHAQQRLKQEVEGEEERLPEVEKRDGYYLVRSRKREIIISEEKLRLLKDLYCGQRMTINEVCRKIDLPRPHFMVIKNAFTIVKDDPPFTDDEFTDSNIDDLVDTTLEKKKDQYFIKLQQKEITAMKAELHKYRQQDYFISKIHEAVTQHMTEFERTYTGPKIDKIGQKKEFIMEPAICDLHLGKLSHETETGENYDYKKARDRFNYVIDDVCTRAEGLPIKKVLYPFGSDFWQINSKKGTTFAGTLVDSDSRVTKLFNVGIEMHITAIDKFRQFGPVAVVLVPGNHDEEISFYALMYLAAWYKDAKDVEVWTDIKSRKYVEYGVNLIGYAHGHQEGKRILGNMQVEAPEAWARARVREWHIAHKHRYVVQEENGVVVRELSALTGKDAWEFGMGYQGAIARTQTFIWHKGDGLHAIWETPIWADKQFNKSVLKL